MLGIRSPEQVADIGVVILCGLDCGSSGRIIKIDLVLTGNIADVGDILAVRAPCGAPLIGPGGLGDIPGDSLSNGDVEDFTTSGNSGPLAIRRDTETTSGYLLQLRTGVDQVRSKSDVDLLSLLGGGIELVEETSLLKHDQLAVGAGELHIVILKVGDLGGGLGLGVVDKDIHCHIPVRNKEDLVAYPHREDILSGVVGDLLDLLAIIDPDLVGHTATIVFPCAELPHHAVVSQLLAIGRIAAETTLRKRKLLRHTTVDRHFPEFSRESVTCPVTVDD